MLYHLSSDPNLKRLTPRVPECAVPGIEDTCTKRICFSTSINGCLQALEAYGREEFPTMVHRQVAPKEDLEPNGWKADIKRAELSLGLNLDSLERENLSYYQYFPETGMFPAPWYYVYVPKNPVEAIKPKLFDQKVTGEMWVMKSTPVKKIGVIFVISQEKLGRVRCRYENGKYTFVIRRSYHYLSMPANYLAAVDKEKKRHKNEIRDIDGSSEYPNIMNTYDLFPHVSQTLPW